MGSPAVLYIVLLFLVLPMVCQVVYILWIGFTAFVEGLKKGKEL